MSVSIGSSAARRDREADEEAAIRDPFLQGGGFRFGQGGDIREDDDIGVGEQDVGDRAVIRSAFGASACRR